MSTKVSRRGFLKISGVVAAGASLAAAPGVAAAQTEAPSTNVTLSYPELDLTEQVSGLEVGAPQYFMYPDDQSMCILLKLGKEVPGGVGPDGDIVAYSIMCTHQGCPLDFDPEQNVFKCPCHYSIFDADLGGKLVCGSATVDLPRIELSYNEEDGTVTAVGVNGLLYGRVSNLL